MARGLSLRGRAQGGSVRPSRRSRSGRACRVPTGTGPERRARSSRLLLTGSRCHRSRRSSHRDAVFPRPGLRPGPLACAGSSWVESWGVGLAREGVLGVRWRPLRVAGWLQPPPAPPPSGSSPAGEGPTSPREKGGWTCLWRPAAEGIAQSTSSRGSTDPGGAPGSWHLGKHLQT